MMTAPRPTTLHLLQSPIAIAGSVEAGVSLRGGLVFSNLIGVGRTETTLVESYKHLTSYESDVLVEAAKREDSPAGIESSQRKQIKR